MKVKWLDSGQSPRSKPNPRYPKGIDIDMSHGAAQTCFTELPYPAPRIGSYIVECEKCGLRVGITTAGRPDDPRSVKLACLVSH